MDKNTWFYLVLAGLSIVYNIYKKGQKKKKEQAFNQPPVSNEKKEGNSWGLDDLISEFQQEYGVEPEVEYVPVEEKTRDQHASSFDDGYPSETDKNGVEEEKTKQTKYVDLVDHTDMDERKTKSAAFAAKTFKEPEYESMPEIDLRQMVIHSTILNRPEY